MSRPIAGQPPAHDTAHDTARTTNAPLTGRLLVAIAALHLTTGLVLFTDPLREIAGAGFVNAVEAEAGVPQFDRMAAFWFMTCGVAMAMLGTLAWWAEPRAGLPAALGWLLAALAAVGVVLMPVSGFWVLFLPAAATLRAARRQPPNPDHPRQST